MLLLVSVVPIPVGATLVPVSSRQKDRYFFDRNQPLALSQSRDFSSPFYRVKQSRRPLLENIRSEDLEGRRLAPLNPERQLQLVDSRSLQREQYAAQPAELYIPTVPLVQSHRQLQDASVICHKEDADYKEKLYHIFPPISLANMDAQCILKKFVNIQHLNALQQAAAKYAAYLFTNCHSKDRIDPPKFDLYRIMRENGLNPEGLEDSKAGSDAVALIENQAMELFYGASRCQMDVPKRRFDLLIHRLKETLRECTEFHVPDEPMKSLVLGAKYSPPTEDIPPSAPPLIEAAPIVQKAIENLLEEKTKQDPVDQVSIQKNPDKKTVADAISADLVYHHPHFRGNPPASGDIVLADLLKSPQVQQAVVDAAQQNPALRSKLINSVLGPAYSISAPQPPVPSHPITPSKLVEAVEQVLDPFINPALAHRSHQLHEAAKRPFDLQVQKLLDCLEKEGDCPFDLVKGARYTPDDPYGLNSQEPFPSNPQYMNPFNNPYVLQPDHPWHDAAKKAFKDCSKMDENPLKSQVEPPYLPQSDPDIGPKVIQALLDVPISQLKKSDPLRQQIEKLVDDIISKNLENRQPPLDPPKQLQPKEETKAQRQLQQLHQLLNEEPVRQRLIAELQKLVEAAASNLRPADDYPSRVLGAGYKPTEDEDSQPKPFPVDPELKKALESLGSSSPEALKSAIAKVLSHALLPAFPTANQQQLAQKIHEKLLNDLHPSQLIILKMHILNSTTLDDLLDGLLDTLSHPMPPFKASLKTPAAYGYPQPPMKPLEESDPRKSLLLNALNEVDPSIPHRVLGQKTNLLTPQPPSPAAFQPAHSVQQLINQLPSNLQNGNLPPHLQEAIKNALNRERQLEDQIRQKQAMLQHQKENEAEKLLREIHADQINRREAAHQLAQLLKKEGLIDDVNRAMREQQKSDFPYENLPQQGSLLPQNPSENIKQPFYTPVTVLNSQKKPIAVSFLNLGGDVPNVLPQTPFPPFASSSSASGNPSILDPSNLDPLEIRRSPPGQPALLNAPVVPPFSNAAPLTYRILDEAPPSGGNTPQPSSNQGTAISFQGPSGSVQISGKINEKQVPVPPLKMRQPFGTAAEIPLEYFRPPTVHVQPMASDQGNFQEMRPQYGQFPPNRMPISGNIHNEYYRPY